MDELATKRLLGPPTGYTDLLEHVTQEKLSTDKATGKDFQKTPIRPSAAGACSRELFFQLQEFHGLAKYETETLNPATSRIFALGHSIESHVIRQFELLKDVFEIRYKQQVLHFAKLTATNPKLEQFLEGSLDLVFWSDKWKCVADVKSKKDKFSSFHKTDWDATAEKLAGLSSLEKISDSAYWADDLPKFLAELRDPFFEANFRQLNLYCNADFIKERGIDHGVIIQYCKNDSRLREIRFRPSEELYRQTIQRFQNVVTAVDTNNIELAPREYSLGSIKCAFCKYKGNCWESQDARQAFFDTLPDKKWPKDTDRLGATGATLENAFEKYEEYAATEPLKKDIEQSIVRLMTEKRIPKIRLSNGNIYECKQLKDSMVVRRTKL